ncbi:MAG TPA: class I SAM-dependent methyltransferase [Pseudonocardiaceae bacterium]
MDDRLVGRLLDLGAADATRIIEAATDIGLDATVTAMFGELLPRIDADLTVEYDLTLPAYQATHHIRLLPTRRAVESAEPAAAPGLRLRHGTAEFVDLFRAVFGGRHDLGVALFDPDDQAVAKHLAASFAERPGLAELASRHGSCKWGAHWGPTHYERYLAPLRDRRIKILEIGVGGHHVAPGGESLRMWRDYFPRAQIYGVDLYDKRDVAEQRIRIFQGDQSDKRFLAELVAETGPVDIVIDDGSHVNDHVLTAFRFLFPHLTDGGLYLIEDLQSSYWPAFGGVPDDRDDPRTTTGFLKTLVDGLQHQEFLAPEDYQPSYLDRSVVGVHVHHLFAVIEKGANTEPSSKANWMRYLDLNRPMAALEIGPQP